MKTQLFTLFFCSLLLTQVACQQDNTLLGADEGPALTTITAQLPTRTSAAPASRAANEGAQINRCILEIYLEGALFSRSVSAVTDKKVSFNARLVQSKTYDLVFWADHVADASTPEGLAADLHYATSDLRAIAMQGDYDGNDDTRDAFTACESLTADGAFVKPVTLKRPFGQIGISTSDLGIIPSASLKPDKVSIAFKRAYTSFNALTGEVSGEQPVEYARPADALNTTGTLSSDFLFARPSDGALVDLVMTFYNGTTKITDNDALSNIPLKRNFRTNVTGNLLTKKGSLSVTVVPEFSGDLGYTVPDYVEVASLDDAKAALTSGSTHIKVTSEVTTSAELKIPDSFDAGTAVSVVIPVSENASLTIGNDDSQGGKNFPAAVAIATDKTASLAIDLPQSTVSLEGTYTDVVAATAPNTLIIAPRTTIDRLTLKQGNVKIFGSVTAIIRDPAYTGTVYQSIDRLRSNCYMLPEAGNYCFNATCKGNSTESVGTPLSAQLLWKDRQSTGMVSNVMFDGGDVLFTTDGTAGNAVIAVYSGAECTGDILWSWHIWCTGSDISANDCRFSPIAGAAYSGNAYTVMDRNLGATSATAGDANALGFIYQWGRKDPFAGSSQVDKVVVTPLYDKEGKVLPFTRSSVGTLEYAISHPNVWLSGSRDWLKVSDDSLWGNPNGYNFPSKTDKSMYDPCPAGYKTAPGDTWVNFAATDPGTWNYGYSFTYDGVNTNYYPSTGFRFGDGNTFSWIDFAGAYWTSSPLSPGEIAADSENRYRGREFAFSSPDGWVGVSPLDADSRAYGFPVRCVRE